jgi:hypothetical protein
MHIGLLIKGELARQKRGVTWFAGELYCDRTNIYKIFRRKSIDTDLLLRISAVLNHNFFTACSDAYEERVEADGQKRYNNGENIQ